MLRKKPMIPLILMLVALIGSATGASAQEVAYEKYVLPNGMPVILHEDHSVPSACINIWYYVASKDEPDRRSGFAHLFEHLMFMGTERVPEGAFDTIMEGGGGYNNASTSEDRTNYYSCGPSELLPTLLWLDADRLEALGEAMTPEKLRKQQDVVRNERRQRYENSPYGGAALRVYELMFPEGHPYHIPVIGTHEDLEAATVEDVKNFFDTYYVPSNASLVVAGDFDPETVKPLIDQWFGTIPRGSDVVHPEADPVVLDGVTRLTLTDRVQFARTEIVWHSPKNFAPGDAEMDLAGNILTDGISSRLYQRLVYKDELALDVTSFQESMLLGSLFRIRATARPGVELEAVEKAIDEEVARFVAEGPTAEELEKQKAKIEYAAVSLLQRLLTKADLLNMYQFYFGEPDWFKRDLDRYRKATAADVQRAARSVLNPDARLILRVIPELDAPETSPREEQPGIAAAVAFTPPAPETFKLNNGITVYHWRRSELPLVAMRMILPAGTSSDPADKAGLASLTVDMLDEGAGERSAIEFADALDLLGASFEAFADRGYTSVSLSSLTRSFEGALALYADAVRRPRFDEKEWERVHTLHVQGLIREQDEPASVARTVGMRAYFGDEHPYSRPRGGTPEAARSVSLEDVRRRYARLIHPEGAVILTAGDLTADEVKSRLNEKLGDWRAARSAKPLGAPNYPEPATKDFSVVLVDRPDAVQTVIRFMMPGPVYGNANRIKIRLLGTILGGSFTSRLNNNLREQHGYTYGAGCRYVMDPSVGYLLAASTVRADVTGASVGEFLKEFRRIRTGDITGEETRKARKSDRMDTIQSFAGLNGVLDTAATLVRNGRPFSDLGEELAAVARVKEGDLNGLAHGAVPLETGVLVLVGDKKAILPQLDGLGLPAPIELTVEGDPAGGS